MLMIDLMMKMMMMFVVGCCWLLVVLLGVGTGGGDGVHRSPLTSCALRKMPPTKCVYEFLRTLLPHSFLKFKRNT